MDYSEGRPFIKASLFKHSMLQTDMVDDFVDVATPDTTRKATQAAQVLQDDKEHEGHGMYKGWIANSSAKHSSPGIFGTDLLRKLYPKHSIVSTKDHGMNILGFPGAYSQPLDANELITSVFFVPVARRAQSRGVFLESVEFGCFRTAWSNYEFTLYVVKYIEGFNQYLHQFVLHEGDEQPIREFLFAVGSWTSELHEEIWVYNQGFWMKDHELWSEVQKADWKDIILDEEFKSSLKKDVFSFFESEDLYKKLAIPWKRGLILFGPPGNGKTISIKAIMKSLDDNGKVPLYVKSFQNWQGEEAAMQQVFDKARQVAPCVIVLEDLDSLINDRNRSFFLNQMDGLSGNDGLLVIGSTNHFDRLDPGLSTRPSRFDRKYEFKDPTVHERLLYAKYWQTKLYDNKKVDFPDSLATEVADATNGFSFAYLKEAFVSTLVIMAGEDASKSTFAEILRGQIRELRKQLDRSLSISSSFSHRSYISAPPSVQSPGARSLDTLERQTPQQASRAGALSAIALGRRYVY